MKTITTTLLIFTFSSVFGQQIDLNKRLDYFKKHHLFVVKVEFEHKKKSQKELDSINKCEIITNKNVKKCLERFWDLNDSIFFIDAKTLKEYRKKFPEAIFLNYKTENFYLWNLQIPKNKNLLNDVSPRLFFGDTTLLGITQELRQLRYNILKGNTMYEGDNDVKIVLILNEPALNDCHKKFIDDFKNKYPEGYQIVDEKFLIDAIYSKDERYIYIYCLCIINVEDGSLLNL